MRKNYHPTIYHSSNQNDDMILLKHSSRFSKKSNRKASHRFLCKIQVIILEYYS